MASPILPGTGLGSGLDTGAIVKALVNADKAPKQGQIDRGTANNTASISGIGTLKSLLSTFRTTITELSSKTNPQFPGYAATTSDSKYVTAVAGNTAVNGNYVVDVQNLATSSKVTSAAFAGGTTSAIPTGTLKISQNGTDYNLDVKAGATLQSVRDSINADASLKGAGISANIVTDSFGSRLVVGSTTTGKGSDISLSGIAGLEIDGSTVVGTSTSPMTATSAGSIGALAVDANYTVDGMTLSSKSNSVDKAVSGMTFNLVAKGTSTITVAANTDGLKASIQKFVDAYNAVANSVTALTKPSLDDDGKPTIPAQLTGDSLPRSILAAMRAPLSEVGSGDKLTVLSQLGITTNQKTGALDFDSTKFTAAMNDKKLGGEVQALFTGEKGLLERMDNAIKPFAQTGGVLDQRTTELNKTKAKLTLDQEALDRRIETLTAVLTKKYNDMDTLVGKLKATASNITSMFEALTAQQKG
ncbi:Flagellar cap protein FliD [Pseudomonas chlororaphis subsp. aurantiaca]|uniref:Flagellar hook-associated protein 2 n=1 Tax=Pseudomonas chlororaphis subsp. aurantiaca TaxID=86192 RepID=A0AAJ0ZI54_9PSED|nr:flagellar filament capping protein FliD [Pseudomonas chlororaphis]AZD20946.1 Flagellar cap protein FliD [Pseudomonas chlororaphis subsp. aurantiaca]AZD34401.1 Flagellar cap protein FliD [Pseudomonas chlororaphis subsp. aurantiaca]AZD40736.1 Flagellar cap protein FliD [Pseudomonas chlororaphis subsp. aurantiaca]AZD47066.1 Flagellar cap protein FliD [Pseudomonas chlororaphis subsp. aurantiaca]MBU4632987.1 flagellar filament capping protein FliD [Pseudomonas chlororaphis subsp. aurantiaca]